MTHICIYAVGPSLVHLDQLTKTVETWAMIESNDLVTSPLFRPTCRAVVASTAATFDSNEHPIQARVVRGVVDANVQKQLTTDAFYESKGLLRNWESGRLPKCRLGTILVGDQAKLA